MRKAAVVTCLILFLKQISTVGKFKKKFKINQNKSIEKVNEYAYTISSLRNELSCMTNTYPNTTISNPTLFPSHNVHTISFEKEKLLCWAMLANSANSRIMVWYKTGDRQQPREDGRAKGYNDHDSSSQEPYSECPHMALHLMTFRPHAN